MPKVLHIGPCDSPGGMANVMHILAEHPPEGWQADLLASHVVGSPWAKWRAYRKARHTLIQMLEHPERRPDVVHLHTAADWSWWRKRRFAALAFRAGCKVVVHIHSGQFDAWLGSSDSKRSSSITAFLKEVQSQTIVLSHGWKHILEPMVGPVQVLNNPISNHLVEGSAERDPHHLLLLGRNDPVKGHEFAIQVCEQVRQVVPDLKVTMSGITSSSHKWISARGWVGEEEKLRLLQSASLLLVPSAFEGQPLVVLEAMSCGLPVLVSDRLLSMPKGVNVASFENRELWASKIIQMLKQPTNSTFLIAQAEPYKIPAVSKKWGEVYSTSSTVE